MVQSEEELNWESLNFSQTEGMKDNWVYLKEGYLLSFTESLEI